MKNFINSYTFNILILFAGFWAGIVSFNHINPWVGLILFTGTTIYSVASIIRKLLRDLHDM